MVKRARSAATLAPPIHHLVPTHVGPQLSNTRTRTPSPTPIRVHSGFPPPLTHTAHMSEAPSRPARGRTTARGGRGGGYGSRGPRNSNGDSAAAKTDTSAEQGELGELKKRYSSQLTTLKELFPDWSDADLVLAMEEADGDLERTIERISEGKP